MGRQAQTQALQQCCCYCPPKISPSFLSKDAGEGQCDHVWRGGQSLLAGNTQLGTIDPSGRLVCTHGPVSLSL